MPSEEELLLLFKESGVEFVEDAAKAVGELGDKMETANQAQQAAVEVLKEEGTVVEDLKEKITKFKRELEALADAHKAGLIAQDAYKERSDGLVKIIAENETVLRRLTASETEAQAAFKALTDAIDKQAAAEEKAAIATDKLAMEANRNLIQEQERLDTIVLKNQASLQAMAGAGEGESGTGGLKGVASSAMKAEKAIASLSSGHGLGRLGSMLEGVLGPMGIPGLGMALGALAFELEPLIPKIKAFCDAWEMGIKPMNDAAKALDALKNAQGEVRQKRALKRVEHQIEILEDKEDEEGVLNAEDTLKLRRLREVAWAKEQEANEEKAGEARKKREKKAELRKIREQEAGVKTISDVEAKTAKNIEHRNKQLDHELESTMRSDEAFNKQFEHDRLQSERLTEQQSRKNAAKARALAEHNARENTPEKFKKRVIDEEIERQGGATADPDFVRQVAAQASRNVTMGADIASAVMYAVQQTQAKIYADFTRGMGQHDRSGQLINPRGGH